MQVRVMSNFKMKVCISGDPTPDRVFLIVKSTRNSGLNFCGKLLCLFSTWKRNPLWVYERLPYSLKELFLAYRLLLLLNGLLPLKTGTYVGKQTRTRMHTTNKHFCGKNHTCTRFKKNKTKTLLWLWNIKAEEKFYL